MNRRGFLTSILAAAAAPAIVRADSLMRMVPTETIVLAPPVAPAASIAVYDLEAMNRMIVAAMANLRDRIEADMYSAVLR